MWRFLVGIAGGVALGVILSRPMLMPGTSRQSTDLVLAVTGRDNANVSLAASGDVVAAVWSAAMSQGGADVYLSLSRDGGATFAAPVRVNSTPGDARVNGEQPPRVAIVSAASSASGPSLVVVWTSKGDIGTRVQFARSDDGGATFSQSASVPGGEAAGNRGWENVTVDAAGHVHVIWLDHREMAADGEGSTPHAHAGHDASPTSKKDGVAMAQLSKLYVSTIGSAESGQPLVAGVCYCCKTAIATAPDGRLVAAWRHVYPGNIRDIAFSSSRDGGLTFAAPVRVSEDEWHLEGCPDDGPAVAIDPTNQVHVVWPTLVTDDKGQPSIGVFYARSSEGAAFSVRQRVPTEGLPHHPQIAIAGGRLTLGWDESSNGSRRAVVGTMPIGADASALARTVISGNGPGVYPSLVASSRGAVVAWTAPVSGASTIHIARVP